MGVVHRCGDAKQPEQRVKEHVISAGLSFQIQSEAFATEHTLILKVVPKASILNAKSFTSTTF